MSSTAVADGVEKTIQLSVPAVLSLPWLIICMGQTQTEDAVMQAGMVQILSEHGRHWIGVGGGEAAQA